MIQLLARGLARLDGAVDQLCSFRHHELGRIPFQHVATGRRDRARRYEHSRARNVALVDRLFDADVAISRALGLDIANRREPLFQRTPRCHDRARCAVGGRELQQLHIVAAGRRYLALQEDMSVTIDETRKNGGAAQFDHPCP